MITDFEYHGSTALSEGLYITDDIVIPTPEERYTEYTIPGRDGSLIYKEGTYPDISIKIPLCFLEKPEDVYQRFGEIRRWLLFGDDNILKLSNQHESHYLVRRIEIDDHERSKLIKGTFNVKFTVQPYQYVDYGDEAIALTNEIYNPYCTSHPIYEISGSGTCTLKVNGNTFTTKPKGSMVIDTDRMIAYDSDGNSMNTAVNGDYADLYLLPGTNTLSLSSGFSVQIKPFWRFI